MNNFSLEDVKYLNIDILKKIRGRISRKIWESSGQERIKHETDHAYLSNHITMLEKSAKYHNDVYLKKHKRNSRQ